VYHHMRRTHATDYTKQIALCMSFILLLALSRAPPKAEAWSISGHEIIVSRACRLYPGSWGEFFRYYEWLLSDTVAYPDTFYKGRDPAESPRHYVDLEIWNQSRPETGTLPFAVETYGQGMSQAIKAGDWNKVLLDAGRLSHYISDICQPYHSTVNYDPVARSGTRLHAVLDGAIRDHLSEINFISSFGTPQTVNFTEYALTLAWQSHSFLAEINNTLIDQNLPWSPRLSEIIENRTNTAIIATINVWHTSVSLASVEAPELPSTKTLRIVTRSTFQTIDVSYDNVFTFTVTDLFGAKTACEIQVDIAGIVLDTTLYRDLTDPLGSYSTVMSAVKLASLRGNVDLTVIAVREGYSSAKLVMPLRIKEPPLAMPIELIRLATAAGVIMVFSLALLMREYLRQRKAT